MKLINADKLKSLFSPALTGKRTYTADEILLSIVSSPTVEAIPIKWIEEWFDQFYGEQGLEWNRCKRFMLSDWEKENADNI